MGAFNPWEGGFEPLVLFERTTGKDYGENLRGKTTGKDNDKRQRGKGTGKRPQFVCRDGWILTTVMMPDKRLSVTLAPVEQFSR